MRNLSQSEEARATRFQGFRRASPSIQRISPRHGSSKFGRIEAKLYVRSANARICASGNASRTRATAASKVRPRKITSSMITTLAGQTLRGASRRRIVVPRDAGRAFGGCRRFASAEIRCSPRRFGTYAFLNERLRKLRGGPSAPHLGALRYRHEQVAGEKKASENRGRLRCSRTRGRT